MRKQYLPLIIGLLIIGIVFFAQIHFKYLFMITLFILIAIPVATYKMCNKDSGNYPTYGCLIGSIAGFFSFIFIINIIMTLIYSNIKDYSLRLDLLFGGLLGASILSTLGIIAGDWVGRRNKREK